MGDMADWVTLECWDDEDHRRSHHLTRKNPHAVALGRKGGSVTSKAKKAASRANGALGGRPPKPKPVRHS